jgi:hypothetical protein
MEVTVARNHARQEQDEEQHDGSERDAAPSQGVTMVPALMDVLEEPGTEGSFPEASLLVDTD